MKITRLETINQHKTRVYLEEEPVFILSSSHIRTLGLKAGDYVAEPLYETILWEILYPRAMKKAVDLLKQSDKSEYELKVRLRREEYPKAVQSQVLENLKEYGYINDKAYAERYVENKGRVKSKAQIRAGLYRKGISKEDMEQALWDGPGEQEALEKAISRKTKDPGSLSYEEKQKIAAGLYRRGFKQEEILKQLNM